jgi:peptide/nickel transport system permease protein
MSDAAGSAVLPTAGAARAAEPTRVPLWRRLARNRNVTIGAVLLALLLAAALLADALATHVPTRLDPGSRLEPPSARHLLGTDEFGRDLYSLVLHGARVSLLVGGVTMLLTTLGGTVIGLVAGYYRRLDLVVMRVMDGLMAFPAILLAIALMAARGPGVWNVIIALSLVYMPRTALLTRSTVLSLRELDYVQAARALGRRDLAVAFRHVLPNCLAPLLVQGTFIFAYAVLAEAILGFLGVGVPPYVPSWGNVIASGKNVIREAFWVSLFPGVTLTLAGLSLNLLGDGLRDTLDPRLRRPGSPSRAFGGAEEPTPPSPRAAAAGRPTGSASGSARQPP